MKYPLALTTLVYKKREDDTILVKDYISEEALALDRVYAHFLRRLDGKTDPYKIRSPLTRREREDFLKDMDSVGFLRDSRVSEKRIGTILFTVWIPKTTRHLRKKARIYNFLLMVLWLPVLAAGIVQAFMTTPDISILGLAVGSVLGTVLGVVLHELSHGMAALACGGHFFECGIGIDFFMPAAYAMVGVLHLKNRKDRIQVSAAGVESNLLIAGVGLLMTGWNGAIAEIALVMALNNILLALINLTLLFGLDGWQIIQELLGAYWFDFIPIWDKRRDDMDANDWARQGVRLALILLQLGFPALILMGILEVIR